MKVAFKDLKEIKSSVSINKAINNEAQHIIEFDKIFPVMLNFYSFDYDLKITPNYHDFLEIVCILEGQGSLIVENKNYTFDKGDIIILGDHEIHTFTNFNTKSFTIAALLFHPDIIYKAGGNEFDFEYLRPFFCKCSNFNHLTSLENNQKKELLGYLKKIYKLLKYKNRNYALEAKSVLLQILLIILKNYEKSELIFNKSHEKKINDFNRLHTLLTLLQKDYAKKISLKKAAELVNMSPTYFCKFFKQVIGCTFSNYLLRIRIDRAKELLITEKTSITNIAYATGFGSFSYFFRKFKKLTGMSPREFKIRHGNYKPVDPFSLNH